MQLAVTSRAKFYKNSDNLIETIFKHFKDFWVTLLVAIFWLAASASWANGIINIQYTAEPKNWIFRNTDKVSSELPGYCFLAGSQA